MLDEHPLSTVMNDGNQSALIPANVENSLSANHTGRPESSLHVGWMIPHRFFYQV